jgi:hypothetical protein
VARVALSSLSCSSAAAWRRLASYIGELGGQPLDGGNGRLIFAAHLVEGPVGLGDSSFDRGAHRAFLLELTLERGFARRTVPDRSNSIRELQLDPVTDGLDTGKLGTENGFPLGQSLHAGGGSLVLTP